MARVLVEFRVDNKGAIQQVRQFKKETDGVEGSTQKASRGMGGLTTALKAAGAAFAAAGVARFLKSSTEAAAEQQRIFTTLANSMKNVGVEYNKVGVELQGTLSALQATTRYGDTDTAAMLNRMINLTGDYTIAMKGLQPIIDMSVSTGQDWKSVSDTIGKAIAGNLGTLSRYGIVLDDATKKMLQNADAAERAEYLYGLLNDRFGGAAQADIQTYAGQMEQLGNYWGDFQETIGSFVTTAPGVNIVFNNMVTAINLMNEGLIAVGRMITIAFNTNPMKFFQGQLKLLEHKFLMFYANVMDKQQHLPEWMGGGKSATTEGMAAVGLAMEAYYEGVELIADATDDAIAKGDEWEKTVRNQTTAVTGLTPKVEDAEDAVKDLNEELDLTTLTGTPYTIVWDRYAAKVREGAKEIQAAFKDAEVSFDDFMEHASGPEIEQEFDQFAQDIGQILFKTIGDALYLAFTGRLDEIGEAMGGMFDNVASAAADSVSNSIMLGASGEDVDWKGVGQTAVAGLASGFASQGVQSGNVAQAAIGGAIAGFASTGTWVGAVAGAAMGIYGALSAPDSKAPTSSAVFGYNGGGWAGGVAGFGDQADISSDQQLNFRQRAYAAYSEMRQRYLNVLRMFEDASLFDLVSGGGHSGFSLDRQDGTAADVFRLLIETEMPAVFDELFANAFREGLDNLGVGSEAFDSLSRELGQLTGADRMGALETYVGTLVDLTNLSADMDWNAIQDVVGMDAMGQFMTGLDAISEAVDVQSMGLDSMTMLERANQTATIEQMVSDARISEIQMLRQIDQMQEGILSTWARFDEDLMLGGMTEGGQLNYYQQQAQAMLAGLQGAGSLEEIDYYNAELLRYLQAIGGMTEGGDWQSGFTTWDEWLAEMSSAAQDATVLGFSEMRDDVREANEELINVLNELIEVLTSPGYTGVAGTPDDPNYVEPDPPYVDVQVDVPAPIINIDVYNTGGIQTTVTSNTPIN